MARPPDLTLRAELLDAVVDDVAQCGIGDRPLRDIAAAAGTSHRMLLHHFGSREELLLAVVERVEMRQRIRLRDLPDEPAAALAAMWADLRRPDLRAFERLFFECYARGVQGERPFDRMLPGAVEDWLAEAAPADRAKMRLGLAVARGLLLDLVATEDVDGVDAAADEFVRLLRCSAGHRRRRASADRWR